MRRRQVLAGTVPLLFGGGVSRLAWAREIDNAQLLVGFVPGGLSDIIARQLADKLHPGYARNVLVENRPGASGQLALALLKSSPADGSVLGVTHSSSLSMYPFTFRHLAYDPRRDFQPVSLVGHTNHGLCVGPSVPASVTTVRQFIAWTRGHPERANYGAPGVGSMPHLIMTVVNFQSQADLRVIAYKGTAAVVSDLMGGQISAASGPVGNFLPQVKAGRIRLLATSGEARGSLTPTVATFREQGFTLTAREWYGVFMPRGGGAAVVEQAAHQLRAAVRVPALVSGLREAGVDVASSSPDELAQMLEADTREWSRLTKEVGFTAES